MQEERSDTPHVLLVYPTGSESRGMVEALGVLDVSVETADHVFSAISRFTARPADVVVLGLADMDDRDVERAIPLFRDLRPGTFLLLAFPPRRRDSAVKALELGADGYLLEPFYLRELVDLVRRGLARSGTGTTEPDEGLLEKLAGAIGHAVGNRLQVIELQLSGEDIDADDIREETDGIRDANRELLAFARHRTLTWGLIDLNQLLREVVSRRGRGRERFRRDLDENLPKIRGDEEKLRDALAALATMAESRGPDGHLDVSTRRDGGSHVRIEFHAPDLTLSGEEKSDFFRPFSGPIRGEVGLRAATAEGIILSHGGTVEVTSPEGGAATVSIRLPVDRRADVR